MTRGPWQTPARWVWPMVLVWMVCGVAPGAVGWANSAHAAAGLDTAGGAGLPQVSPAAGSDDPAPLLLAMGSGPRRTVTLTPGTVFRDCRTCPEMVVIAPGRFLMGAAPSEEVREQVPGRYQKRAEPRHEVAINRYLAVGRTELTRQDFARFAGATSYAADGCWTFERDRWLLRLDLNWRNPGIAQTDNDPVVCVSWNDANAYLGWLSHETRQTYRLLSEAEWEYAARAGSDTARPWGVTVERNFANCNGCGSRWDNLGTAPVGTFIANAFGLSDLIGNAAEWVEDCWYDTYDNAPVDGSARVAAGCRERVLRGASWRDPPRSARPAHRDRELSEFRANTLGFRIVRTVGQ